MLSYAEIHYRPRLVPSLLYSKRPEILFDVPSRVDPGKPIPLFLFIKDSHQFPVKIDTVHVRIFYTNGANRTATFPYNGMLVNEPIWWDSFNIMPQYHGIVAIDPYACVRIGSRRHTVHVDNYRGTSHKPFAVNVSAAAIPHGADWYPGDIHCHSYFTSDQIEFGAPIEALTLAAHCMGLKWIAVTDHSYDLDDLEDSWSAPDPLLHKWHMLNQISNMLKNQFAVIPGEEVTCRNGDGRNCHMLALHSRRFIKGSGDGGERGLDNNTEKTIGEAAVECVEWGGISCAAHPCEHVPWIERLILNRGAWSADDLDTTGITAMQVANGEDDDGFHEGIKAWLNMLMGGKRMYLFGGGDSHGDMNRQRSIGIPFVSVKERAIHLYGCTRTIVRAVSDHRDDIFDGLRRGRCVVSDGPFIDLQVFAEDIQCFPGDTVSDGLFTVSCSFRSSSEYGMINDLSIIIGFRGEAGERTIYSCAGKEIGFEHTVRLNHDETGGLYVRAECHTVLEKYCLTNPIWIRPL